MKVLALDLATCTGFAFGDISKGERPKYGYVNLPKTGDDVGYFLVAFEQWLTDKIVFDKPGTIIFEAPILTAGRTSPAVARKLFGLANVVEMFCYRHSISVRSTNIMAVKKYFTGRGNAKKHDMIKAATDLGFKIAVDDEADALGIYFQAMNHFYPAQAQQWDSRSAARLL